MAVLQLEFPPSVGKEEAFLLTDWRCSAAEIAERRCAAEKTAPQKEHTSLKAHRAREFKSKGILLQVFALVCLIFMSHVAQQHVHNAATKTKAKTKKKKKKKKKRKKKQMKKKRQKKRKENDQCFSTRKL